MSSVVNWMVTIYRLKIVLLGLPYTYYVMLGFLIFSPYYALKCAYYVLDPVAILLLGTNLLLIVRAFFTLHKFCFKIKINIMIICSQITNIALIILEKNWKRKIYTG